MHSVFLYHAINAGMSIGIVNAGMLEAGATADLVARDLTTPTLADWTPETLLDSFLFGSGAEAITEVWGGGRRVR